MRRMKDYQETYFTKIAQNNIENETVTVLLLLLVVSHYMAPWVPYFGPEPLGLVRQDYYY